MFVFNIKIAGIVVRIESQYYGIVDACKDFISQEEPNFAVKTTVDDFDRDAKYIKTDKRREELSNVYIEVTSVLRKVSDEIVNYGAFMMHGAVIAIDNNAYLFTGISGIGKTTHILKWVDNCPDTIIVNGDKPFIMTYEDDRRPQVCGSPWAGKENLYTNIMVPLKAIIMIERGENNYIEQVSFKDAFPTLFQQIHRPENEEKMRTTLKLIQRLNPEVTFWRFQCNNFKEDSFDVTYKALTGCENE